MKLEKIDQKKKVYIIRNTIFIIGIIIGILLFRSYALYKDEKETNIANEDVKLAFTINGEKSKEAFPSKTSGYEVNSVTCKNGVTASWNQEKWGLSNIESNETQKIQCSIDFSIPMTLINYLKNLNSNELVDDETADHNLRYIGSNPNNYVSFNVELWRIIGVMNDVADDNGVVEPRVKLIRGEELGSYAWDNKASGVGSSTSENGSNDWSDSALMEVLNSGAYYNRTSGSCPSGKNGATKSCDFTSKGLTNEAKNMISKVKWKLGGTGSYNDSSNGLVSHWYGYERGTTVYTGHNTEWTGSVGLMYPSDYGYATSGGSTINRESCLNKILYNWGNADDCRYNNWLYPRTAQFTISPYTSNSYDVIDVSSTGKVSNDIAGFSTFRYVWPVVYLNTSLNIKSGTGTSTDPFILRD